MTSLTGKAVLNESEIVVGLRDRDPHLISRLIDVYGGRLLRYLHLLTGNRPTAEDIFQETWVRVLEKGYQYNGDYSFQAWLFSIARHLVIDLSRQKKAMSLDEVVLEGELHDPASATAVSPLDLLCREEQETSLLAYVSRLPQRHREVFLLRYSNEMKLGEIAEVTSVPLSTVKSRLYRAATVLQGRLSTTRQNRIPTREMAEITPALPVPEGQGCLSTA